MRKRPFKMLYKYGKCERMAAGIKVNFIKIKRKYFDTSRGRNKGENLYKWKLPEAETAFN